jgi:hypothetical protein
MSIMSSRASNARSGLLALAAAAVVGLSLLVSGCGSSPSAAVAQIASTTTSTNSASPRGSASASPAAYPACMRKHGVPQFPDPGPNGELQIRVGPGTGINPDSSQFKAAEQACRKLRPEGRPPSPQQQAKDLQKMLDFSRCMRSHGVPGFPDPKSSGSGIQLSIGKNSGIDPNSSVFKAAQQACQKLIPKPPDGNGGPTTGGGGGASNSTVKP